MQDRNYVIVTMQSIKSFHGESTHQEAYIQIRILLISGRILFCTSRVDDLYMNGRDCVHSYGVGLYFSLAGWIYGGLNSLEAPEGTT